MNEIQNHINHVMYSRDTSSCRKLNYTVSYMYHGSIVQVSFDKSDNLVANNPSGSSKIRIKEGYFSREAGSVARKSSGLSRVRLIVLRLIEGHL